MIDDEDERGWQRVLDAFGEAQGWACTKCPERDRDEAHIFLQQIFRHLKDAVEGRYIIDVWEYRPACNAVEVGMLRELARCFEKVKAPAILVVPFDPDALGMSSKYMRTTPD
jgi:hypothetical protein